jgi:hypothetical protein
MNMLAARLTELKIFFKFAQPVLIQSYEDEFDLNTTISVLTPA